MASNNSLFAKLRRVFNRNPFLAEDLIRNDIVDPAFEPLIADADRGLERFDITDEIAPLGLPDVDNDLSSSWLNKGTFVPGRQNVLEGSMVLGTDTGSLFTIGSFNRDVWNRMKLATGQNGSGAGSVLWQFDPTWQSRA